MRKADGLRPLFLGASLVAVGKRLGKLGAGGAVDMESSGRAFMDAFATGKFGRMSLEKPGDAPIWEAL